MTRNFVVVDVESNGLDDRKHQAVEIAWWDLSTGERDEFVPSHSPRHILATGSIRALRISRYLDRLAEAAQDFDNSKLLDLWKRLDGATLVGSNPRFDAGMLRKAFDRCVYPTPFHYRLWDISVYAAGVLELDELPGLATVCELLGLPAPDHTARGDVTSAGLAFLELRARAGKPLPNGEELATSTHATERVL